MLVGAAEVDRGDRLVGLEHRAAHRVDRLLQREAVVLGEGVEQGAGDF